MRGVERIRAAREAFFSGLAAMKLDDLFRVRPAGEIDGLIADVVRAWNGAAGAPGVPVAGAARAIPAPALNLNLDGDEAELWRLLERAEGNAETEFEEEFCASIRERLETYGARVRLSEAQRRKLECIAEAGGWWERGDE